MPIWTTRAICPTSASKATPEISIARSLPATSPASCSWIRRKFKWPTPLSFPNNAQRKHLPPVEPLYTIADAEKVLEQFVSVNYERPVQILDGVTVTFRDAGHILGSAQVILDIRREWPEIPLAFQRRCWPRQRRNSSRSRADGKCGLSANRIHLCRARARQPR